LVYPYGVREVFQLVQLVHLIPAKLGQVESWKAGQRGYKQVGKKVDQVESWENLWLVQDKVD
jgi:hypothetical protein